MKLQALPNTEPRIDTLGLDLDASRLRGQRRLIVALHEAAARRAERLREEARDDFWRGADALVSDAARGLVRSTERLFHRLARHAAHRGAEPAACTTRGLG